ncbi:hypothetical protein CSV67_00180 [Sporosarcina sp. P2]|nr:hypothetical protein CSV67_00180 [Sporosarcina sp. P2]
MVKGRFKSRHKRKINRNKKVVDKITTNFPIPKEVEWGDGLFKSNKALVHRDNLQVHVKRKCFLVGLLGSASSPVEYSFQLGGYMV